MKNFDKKDKYKLDLEIVTKSEYNRSKIVNKIMQRNLKKVIMNRLEGKTGECQRKKKRQTDKTIT